MEWLQLLRPLPILFEFSLMRSCPFPDELTGRRGPDLAGEGTPREVEGGVLPLMLRVKVLRCVIIKVHPDDDPEKCGDDRHVAMLANRATDSPTSHAFSRERPPRANGRAARRPPPVDE